MTDHTTSDRREAHISDAARTHLKRGQSLYRAREYDAAVKEFDDALAAKPFSAEAYKCRGDALVALLRYDEAKDSYRQSVREDPDVRAEEPDTRAEAYNELGEVLYTLRRFGEAADSYLSAAKLFDGLEAGCRDESDHLRGNQYEARSGDMHNSRGFALFALKKYKDAQAEFEVAIAKGRIYPYAYHSLATLLWAQGKYKEAKDAWDEARLRYDEEANIERAKDKSDPWPGHFLNFGNLLHEVYGEFDRAEEIYLEALKLAPRSVSARAGLLNLYLEKAGSAAGRTESYWKAKAIYEETRAILLERLKTSGDLDSMLSLGEIYLAWGDYDGAGRWQTDEDDSWAEGWLKKALEKDKGRARGKAYTRTAKPLAGLGVLYSRQKNYPKAITHFRQALEIENDDLSLRSNLAETYLRAGSLDAAEGEYKYIIGIAPEHLESLIGLGEVYLARGEANDPDMYAQAVTWFTAALKLAEQGKGSKRLKKKEAAKVLYLRAYARVKGFEGAKLLKDQRPLFQARDDFRLCFKSDPEYYLAQRAVEKIEGSLTAHTPQRVLEKFGPILILVSSAAVFVLAQLSFFLWSGKVTADQYIFMTFGSLLLMTASSYLPQVLKLKFAGLELEKSIVDQVTPIGTLGITKGV